MSSSPSPAAPLASDRLHGLDALRGGALLLGVVLHASMAYFPTRIWVVQDSETSPVASGLFFAIHLFRMTTFFLIAGLFAHMMLNRRGVVGFIKDRAIRIAGPLAGLWWIVFGAILAVLIWTAVIANGGTMPTGGSPPPPLTAETFPLTHLWFLWVLLILYAAMLILRAPFALLDRDGGWGRRIDGLIGALIGPWTPAVMAAPLALAFWLSPQWIAFFGIQTPDTGLVPNAVALTAFGTVFGLGFLLDRRRGLLNRIAGLWAGFAIVAVIAGVGAMVLVGGPVPILKPIADPGLKAATAAVMAFAIQSATFAALALTLRFASGYSATRRYLADASYWIYIVHLPLVMVGQVLATGVDAPWWIKMGAVVVGTLAISLVTYELLIRHSFMGRWLNGRRIPWRKPAAVAAPAE
ncbi:acyltransferase family protein [soil metagenome]